MISTLAEQYIQEHGNIRAMAQMVYDLERGDAATFKRGYTRPNAVTATAEAFDVSRDEVVRQLTEQEQQS